MIGNMIAGFVIVIALAAWFPEASDFWVLAVFFVYLILKWVLRSAARHNSDKSDDFDNWWDDQGF